MRNFLAEKQNIFNSDNLKKLFSPKLKLKEIESFYLKSAKNTSHFGLEYERLSLDKKSGKCAKYDDVAKIIKHFCSIASWEIIKDKDTIIGAKSTDNCSISLEPGCQLEISLRPYENISDIDFRLSKIISTLDDIAKAYGVIFLSYGINPSQSPDEIKLLNKRRYILMNNYLPNCSKAELCTSMMRKTAGMQVNIDYSDKKDAYLKLKFFNMIMPFMTGLTANSPFDNNILTENRTNRANIWLYTGENRCNLFYKDVFEHKFSRYNNVFKNYIDNLLDVPMIFIEREDEYIPINGLINFREFLKQGFSEYTAEINDFILHQSLCFPDVRLKQYIEIRNHDSNKPEYALMLCAFYKGLSKCNFENLIKKFNYLKLNKIEQYYKNIIKFGLNFKVHNNLTGWDIINCLFDIARKKLDTKERYYLEPMAEMLKNQKTNADIIKEHNISTVEELIEFIK